MFVSIFDIEIMLRADFTFVCLKLVRVDDNELLSRMIYVREPSKRDRWNFCDDVILCVNSILQHT